MERCALCPNVNTCIPPTIPDVNIYTMFIGEAPGYDENRAGEAFVGKTGKEFKLHYLPLAGLKPEHCYITNAIKCMPTTSKGKLDPNKKAHLELLQSCCDAHLYREIAEIQPALLVPMGAFACRAIDTDINLDMHHGRPFLTRLGIWAFPMWHPAGGLHEPKKMLQIRNDWMRLKRYLKGTLDVMEDEHPIPDYRVMETANDIYDDITTTIPLAGDTETSRSLGPYCLTYSQAPGTGRLIRADRPDLLAVFQEALDQWESIIIFQNWLYDWPVTEEMGLKFPHARMRDTMIRSFHLGNLPQGLKALAYRELGMAMQDFEDLVKPYSTQQVIGYYRRAYDEDWPKPEGGLVRGDDMRWKVYKPQSMHTKLKVFFTNYMKNEDKDVFKAWENWEADHARVEAVMGKWPGLDIAHVPFDRVLHYACRDSDAVLRLWPVLERMRKLVRKMSQEYWGVDNERNRQRLQVPVYEESYSEE